MKRIVLMLLLLAANSTSVWAAEFKTMTYSEFERRVAFNSMAECPKSIARPNVFCRIMVGELRLHVFAFSAIGKKPLVAFASYDLETLDIVSK
ncbi:MAG: hypothetical protein AAGA50_31345 [Pseudomonadota bacterium]